MVRFKHYRSGRLYGIQYWFDRVNDQLPEHAHDASTFHNIVCLGGVVFLIYHDGEPHRIGAGEIYDFDGSRRHRIVAASPDSVIINFYLNGMPEGYDRLPPEELQGVVE
jgi:hypothetical protein